MLNELFKKTKKRLKKEKKELFGDLFEMLKKNNVRKLREIARMFPKLHLKIS